MRTPNFFKFFTNLYQTIKHKKQTIKKIYAATTIFTIFLVVVFYTTTTIAQKKIDLDDVKIQGESHKDNRFNILAREKNTMKNYVKYRINYRAEMGEELPEPSPKVSY